MEGIAAKIRNRYYEDVVRDLETKKNAYRTQRETLRAAYHTDKKASVAKMPGTQLVSVIHCIQPSRGF